MEITERSLGEARQKGARPRPRAGLKGLVVFFAILAVLVATAIVAGLVPRLSRERALLAASESAASRPPAVNVAAVRTAPTQVQLELPGDLQALIDAGIFARADGYVARRLVDYGYRVKKGQLLAEITTPELDEQIRQAHATLAQSQSSLRDLQANLTLAQANLKLAQVTYNRWKHLTDKGVFSHQDTDEKEAALEVRQAEVQSAQARIAAAQDTIRANEASLRRLEELKAFDQVTAPFDGVITVRNIDVGALINAGNGGPAREMFHIAQIDPLRIFVNVPQANLADVHVGQSAELRVQEMPGQVFPARVTNVSNALDPASRAMLTVLEVPNPKGILLPGMYAQVRFTSVRSSPGLRVPGDALILGRQGPRVAVVDPESRIHLRPIHIARDYGPELEVSGELNPGDLVVVNPGDAVREGARVEVHKR
ncbi:MAG TPA: efflux RND transporter periplasmic adaptor subunit [Bryobacteraceae bacterium]|nr:efflux RND transporter periplasmic adaptor subunit [Bryobacteraceae bacterium]